MALNPEKINFFLRRISNASMQTFGSEVKHLFDHLDNEVKDNPVYQRYEESREKWSEWPGETQINNWVLPPDFEDAKSLIYALYRKIAEKPEEGYSIPGDLTYDPNGNFETAIINFNNQFLEYLQQILQEILNANPEIESSDIEKVKGNRVFIIHGHDELMKKDVQLLLERAGVNNLVLHEQPDKGRNIIDKLIEESDTSNYAIALMSPDDKDVNGGERARQNVILEIGYFVGKLGKERVRLLRKGDVEIPSDLSGILYENYDSEGAWKIKILKELLAVGIYVDMGNVMKNY